jgi:hypothetical protein
MVDWQITATTIVCEAVANEVTLLVHGDWSVKCTGFERYTGNRRAKLELVRRSLDLKRTLECKGLQCPHIAEYKQKLIAEEDARVKSK